MDIKKISQKAGLAALFVGAMTVPSFAEDAKDVAQGTQFVYIFNTLLFLIGGFLVMWMAAGFAMLEAGMVRSKNVSMQCTKNIALFSIGGIMYWAVGYNIMYEGVDGGYIGTIVPKAISSLVSEQNAVADAIAAGTDPTLYSGALTGSSRWCSVQLLHRLFRARWLNASKFGHS